MMRTTSWRRSVRVYRRGLHRMVGHTSSTAMYSISCHASLNSRSQTFRRLAISKLSLMEAPRLATTYCSRMLRLLGNHSGESLAYRTTRRFIYPAATPGSSSMASASRVRSRVPSRLRFSAHAGISPELMPNRTKSASHLSSWTGSCTILTPVVPMRFATMYGTGSDRHQDLGAEKRCKSKSPLQAFARSISPTQRGAI